MARFAANLTFHFTELPMLDRFAAEGGRLVLAHDDGWQHLLAPAIWVSWAVAALASLPLRRRRTAA